MHFNFTKTNISTVIIEVEISENEVLWSQTCIKIEMRLRCFLVINNWQLVVGNG